MSGVIWRAAAAALLAALVAVVSLVFTFGRHPQLTFEMDRDLPPRVTSGFYPVEFSGDDTFAWTSARALVNVAGVDRRDAWRCVVRFRGGRAPGERQPSVTLEIDGRPLVTRPATNDYQEIA